MKHRNDPYANDLGAQAGESPAIPAATVVLLRDAPEVEVLMLHKASQIAFGGMWVFPGGRIDAEDYPATRDINLAARNAAVREAREEAGLVLQHEGFVWFAHWTPPPSSLKRFATWFFIARADDQLVAIDGGEIQNHQWIKPALALTQHAAGEIDLAPPTWVTLYQLAQYPSVATALDHLRALPPVHYVTRPAQRADGVRVVLWQGDAGYATSDPTVEGARHRLVMAPGGFRFENTLHAT